MTTLTSPPLAPLLDRLFAEADAASPLSAVADLSADERARMMRSKTDYLAFYGRLKDMPLAASRETCTLLHMLARGCGACSIVEFGTSFGISTLHLAAALRDNGGGRLVTAEFEPSMVARARATMAAAGLDDVVEVREGDALNTLGTDLPATVDLLLLDGAKGLYPEVLALAEGRLRPGALVVADDADKSPDYLARVRSPAQGYMSCRSASTSSCPSGSADTRSSPRPERSQAMTTTADRTDPAVRHVLALTGALFLSYPTVAMSLPAVAVHVVKGLGLGNGLGTRRRHRVPVDHPYARQSGSARRLPRRQALHAARSAALRGGGADLRPREMAGSAAGGELRRADRRPAAAGPGRERRDGRHD